MSLCKREFRLNNQYRKFNFDLKLIAAAGDFYNEEFDEICVVKLLLQQNMVDPRLCNSHRATPSSFKY